MSGVEAAKAITEMKEESPLFIFTTAYDEYAMDAFDIEAIDYLLKPYEEANFKGHEQSTKAFPRKEETCSE